MTELSLCMIVKNEEERLARCLSGVQGAADEIVIVDTGSTDGTKRVAGQFTSRVYDYAWDDDFSAARNASLDHATKPFIVTNKAQTTRNRIYGVVNREDTQYILLDTPGLHKPKSALGDYMVNVVKESVADVDAVMTPYHTGIGQDGRPTLIYERERIVRRDAGFVFSGVVHEAMRVSGNVLHEDIVIRHERGDKPPQGRRNLDIYEKWMARGRRMTARDSYYYAREWMDWGDPGMAERAFAQFLAMPDGWIENRIDAYIQRAECLQRLGRRAEARQSLLASLALGAPRAEALCALGDLEMEESAWQAAAFWYRAAMLCRPPEGGGFVRPELYDYVPAMQLCVCYDRMGQYRLAAQMNERALLLHPGDAAALANRRYFETRFSEPKTEQKKEKQG